MERPTPPAQHDPGARAPSAKVAELTGQFLLLITSVNNGYDGSMMNGLQTIDNWQEYFHHPHGSVLGVFNAIQSIGGIVGLPLAPWLNDKYGRRKTLFIGSCRMCLSNARDVY